MATQTQGFFGPSPEQVAQDLRTAQQEKDELMNLRMAQLDPDMVRVATAGNLGGRIASGIGDVFGISSDDPAVRKAEMMEQIKQKMISSGMGPNDPGFLEAVMGELQAAGMMDEAMKIEAMLRERSVADRDFRSTEQEFARRSFDTLSTKKDQQISNILEAYGLHEGNQSTQDWIAAGTKPKGLTDAQFAEMEAKIQAVEDNYNPVLSHWLDKMGIPEAERHMWMGIHPAKPKPVPIPIEKPDFDERTETTIDETGKEIVPTPEEIAQNLLHGQLYSEGAGISEKGRGKPIPSYIQTLPEDITAKFGYGPDDIGPAGRGDVINRTPEQNIISGILSNVSTPEEIQKDASRAMNYPEINPAVTEAIAEARRVQPDLEGLRQEATAKAKKQLRDIFIKAGVTPQEVLAAIEPRQRMEIGAGVQRPPYVDAGVTDPFVQRARDVITGLKETLPKEDYKEIMDLIGNDPMMSRMLLVLLGE